MKTLATEIKIGQEIKYGNQWGKVIARPTQSSYSAIEVDVKVITLPGKVRRRNGVVTNDAGGIETQYSFRKTTMVQTR